MLRSFDIFVGRVQYDSISDAAKAHGITSSSAIWRIKSKRFPGWTWKEQ
jgi:hypothetical protein